MTNVLTIIGQSNYNNKPFSVTLNDSSLSKLLSRAENILRLTHVSTWELDTEFGISNGKGYNADLDLIEVLETLK